MFMTNILDVYAINYSRNGKSTGLLVIEHSAH